MADVNKDITLLDTDAMRLAISDDREFKTSGGRYTNAGKARLNAIRLIEDEQDKGNRFIVSDGRYTLHNTEGEAMPFAGLDKEKGYKLKGWVNVDKRVDREASRIINSDAFIKADIEEVEEVKEVKPVTDPTPEDVDNTVTYSKTEAPEEKDKFLPKNQSTPAATIPVVNADGSNSSNGTGKGTGTGEKEGSTPPESTEGVDLTMDNSPATKVARKYYEQYVDQLNGIRSLNIPVGRSNPLSSSNIAKSTRKEVEALTTEIDNIRVKEDAFVDAGDLASARLLTADRIDAEAYRKLLILNHADKMNYLVAQLDKQLEDDLSVFTDTERSSIKFTINKHAKSKYKKLNLDARDSETDEGYNNMIIDNQGSNITPSASMFDGYASWMTGESVNFDLRYNTDNTEKKAGMSNSPQFTMGVIGKIIDRYTNLDYYVSPFQAEDAKDLNDITAGFAERAKENIYMGGVPDVLGPRVTKALEFMDMSEAKYSHNVGVFQTPEETRVYMALREAYLKENPGKFSSTLTWKEKNNLMHEAISTVKKNNAVPSQRNGGELRELSKVRKFLTGGPYTPQNNTGQFHGPAGTYTPTGAHPVFTSTNTMTALDALDALKGIFGPGSGGYMTSDPNDKDYSKASIKDKLKLARSKFTIPQNNLLKPGLDGIRVGQTGLKLGYDNIIDSIGAYAAWKQKPAKEEAFHKTFVEGFVPTVRGAKEADTTFEEENINNISSGYKGSDIVKKERTSMVAAAQRNAALDKLAQARHTYARSEEARVATETGLRDQGIAKNRVELNNVANANRLAEHSTNKSNNLARMAFKAQNLANITEIGKNVSLDLEESATKSKRDTLDMDISRMSAEYNKMVLANTSGTPAGVALKGELDHARTMARYS